MGYLSGINWFAVVASAVASMVIGFVWYSPILFAKPWCEAMGYDLNDKAKMDEMRKSAGPMYGAAMVCSLITAMILAKMASFMDLHSPTVGVKLGFAMWLGFITTTQLTGVLFSGQKIKLWVINTAHQLVSCIAMGIIVCVWRA